MKRPRIKNLN